MALLKVGSIDHFAVTANDNVLAHLPELGGIKTFSTMTEVSRRAPENAFRFDDAAQQRGLALKKIELTKGAESWLKQIFSKKNDIYFIAWAWDLSGDPIHFYPGTNFDPKALLIPMDVGRVRTFGGAGINLFPPKVITGGISVRIQLFESDGDMQKLGTIIKETAASIANSPLNNLISGVSAVTGVSGLTVELIKDAAIELSKVIGSILEANTDDYVDFFEGHYPASITWEKGEEECENYATKIVLTKY